MGKNHPQMLGLWHGGKPSYKHMYTHLSFISIPIGSMYGIYANIWGILMVNITIYSIHGSYGIHIIAVTWPFRCQCDRCSTQHFGFGKWHQGIGMQEKLLKCSWEHVDVAGCDSKMRHKNRMITFCTWPCVSSIEVMCSQAAQKTSTLAVLRLVAPRHRQFIATMRLK